MFLDPGLEDVADSAKRKVGGASKTEEVIYGEGVIRRGA